MSRTIVVGVLVAVAILVGCKKKEAASGGAAASGVGGSAAGGGPATGPVPAGCLTRLASGAVPDGDLVLKKECGPVTVDDEVWIDAKVTIEPGVTLRFAPKAALGIGALGPGILIAQGTPEAPIVFTSSGAKVAGAWDGVHLMSNSHGSRLENVVIEYAGANPREYVLEVIGAGTSLRNVTLRAGKGWGLTAGGRRVVESVDGCVFQDLSQGAMHVSPAQLAALGTNTFDAHAVVEIEGGGLEENATLRAGPTGAIYRLTGALEVGAASEAGPMPVLTIEPGVLIEANADGHLLIGTYHGASLKAVGSSAKPIRFTGVDKIKDSWEGISLGGGAKDVVIQHAVVEYAKSDAEHGAIHAGESVDVGAEATIEDVSFEHLKGVGLSVSRHAKVTGKGLKVVDAAAAELRAAP